MAECPICNSKHTTKLLGWRNKYSIFKCSVCKLLFSLPIPNETELNTFYQGFLFKKPNLKKIQALGKVKKKELTKLFSLTKKDANKTFLDYGGGTGIAFYAAKSLGLNTYYFDIDAEAITFVEQHFKLDTQHKIASNDIKKFHYIFSDNVIEHYPNPEMFIKNLYNKLNIGGRLVIKTPNGSSNENIFYPLNSIYGYLKDAIHYNNIAVGFYAFIKGYWFCDPPRHIYSFSAKSFHELAKKLNITSYQVDYYNPPLFENTLSKLFFRFNKSSMNIKTLCIKVLSIPFVAVELFIIKPIHFLARKFKLVTPMGLVLTISK